jgi:hypothetical protein
MLPLFDKFFSQEQALYLQELFQTKGLHPFVQAPMEIFDVATGANTADLYFTLHLPQEEFAKADELIYEEIIKHGIPTDYYLRAYTNQELHDIIAKPDTWSKQDIAAARILLEEKGEPINYALVSEKAEERFVKLREQVTLKPVTLLLLYGFCVIGSVLGLIIGPMLLFMKNTDYNGKKQLVFSKETREHGLILFILSLCSAIGWWVIL